MIGLKMWRKRHDWSETNTGKQTFLFKMHFETMSSRSVTENMDLGAGASSGVCVCVCNPVQSPKYSSADPGFQSVRRFSTLTNPSALPHFGRLVRSHGVASFSFPRIISVKASESCDKKEANCGFRRSQIHGTIHSSETSRLR